MEEYTSKRQRESTSSNTFPDSQDVNNPKRQKSEELNDSPESSTSNESRGSTAGKIPNTLSRWKEEHLQNLGIVVQYEEELTPLQLVKDSIDLLPHIRGDDGDFIKEIEAYFLGSVLLKWFPSDQQFTSLTPTNAAILRTGIQNYSIENPKILSERVIQWLQRFQFAAVQFAQNMYYMVLKREFDRTKDINSSRLEPLIEYHFQFLFDAFVRMFDLQNFQWMEPFLRNKTLQLPDGLVTGKADIIFCQDIILRPDDVTARPGCWQEMRNIIAVCEVEKSYKEAEQEGQKITRQHGSPRVSSTAPMKGCLPPHLSFQELGQFGGELLLYSQNSIFNDRIFGIYVQETKVSFAALKISSEQYCDICEGNHEKGGSSISEPTLIITKPYDFTKKEEIIHLIRPLLQFAMIQKKFPHH